jgi:hypothetical protein
MGDPSSSAFVIAPQTMPLDQWLRQKGQPTNNEWLQAQQGKAEAAPTIDLEAEKPAPELPPTRRSIRPS